MANRDDLRGLAPEIRVRVNGADLPAAAQADLVAVEVLLDVDAPSMFALRLVNWDGAQHKLTWSDTDQFVLGSAVEVLMGYVDRLETVMVGEITGLEMEMHAEGTPLLIVRGYDRRHRLMRGHRTRTFRQMKDGDIASQLARDAGLAAQVEDTRVSHAYVVQHNQTDFEFLQARAARIGYEVVVEDKTLFFHPPPITTDEALTLDREGDLVELSLRLSSMNEVGELSVRGWDPKTKQPIVATASPGSERSQMGGAASGPSTVQTAFEDRPGAASVAQPVASQAEADQMAQGRFDAMALDYVWAEGLCAGRSDLRAGMVIRLDGLGQRFSGRYYVTAATHSFSPLRGYRTRFNVRRNGT